MPTPTSPYPQAAAFHFSVTFGTNAADADASFQEVTGIGPEFETEALPEGGENRYTLQVPKGMRHPKLVLKRGIAPLESKLVAWCKAVMEGGLNKPIYPKMLNVFLLDADGRPLRCWSIVNAWPVHWETEGFNSTKNEVAVEKIELSYAYSTREV
ncbi:MAG: phage tail protein [Gemmatimonadaceae bacterium]|nr:phage tail protein [Gemmatimonadaceae bacterium]